MSKDLENLEIVVAGGTGALGRAVLSRVLATGAHCHVPNAHPGELADFPYRTHPGVVLWEGVDLADAAAVERFYARMPPLWASIHLAGGFAMAAIADTSPEMFEKQFRTNTYTAFLCCRAAVASMRSRAGNGTAAGGRIVNVAARPALEPRLGAGMTAYTASKAAVAAFTQALAEELSNEEIWVNAIAPAVLDTPANRAAMPGEDFSRWAPLDAVADAISYLVSPANKTVRGAIIPVYGRAR